MMIVVDVVMKPFTYLFLFLFLIGDYRKIQQQQISWEQQNLYNIKNPLMAGPKSIYGSRGIPVGNISNYSCDGFGLVLA